MQLPTASFNPPSENDSPKRGDYVLATKFSDGDPHDHWAIGFFGSILGYYSPPRYSVLNEHGGSFRGNGFRRVEKITAERGRWILDHAQDIELSGRSVWYFAQCPIDEFTGPQK